MCASRRLARRGGAALALACLLLAGCVERALMESMVPFDYEPYPDSEPPEPTEGAIWPGATPSGSFLFFDSKARGVGDLVTVVIREDLSAEGTASTELSRDSDISASVSSQLGFQDVVENALRKLLSPFADGGLDRAPPAVGSTANVIQAGAGNEFQGEGSTSRRGRFAGVITCRVVDVLPGRVFHIRGRRSIVVNHEVQYVTLEGLVRQDDIGIDNTVASTELAEVQLSFDGLGVIDDRQRPGLVGRLFGWFLW